MKWLVALVLLCVIATGLACGGSNHTLNSGELTGNWQITLMRDSNPNPEVFSGFLQQSGSAISGSLVLGDGCSGVGSVSGTLNGQNLELDINEFGQDTVLTGTLPAEGPSGATYISGTFSSLSGGCKDHPDVGTWSAVLVSPIAGSFQGTFVGGLGTLNVTGVLNQGPNTGSSTANLSGTITAVQSGTQFCSYLSTATITGLISGTAVTLNLYGPDGSLITQIPATISSNATSLTCSNIAPRSCFSFQEISSGCTGETGSIQISFP